MHAWAIVFRGLKVLVSVYSLMTDSIPNKDLHIAYQERISRQAMFVGY